MNPGSQSVTGKIEDTVEGANSILKEGRVSIDSRSGFYTVEGESKERYQVSKAPDGWYCSCEDFKNNGFCEHILAVNIGSSAGLIKETERSRGRGRSRRRSNRKGSRRSRRGEDRNRRDRQKSDRRGRSSR